MKFTQIVSSDGWLKNPFPFYIYPIIPTVEGEGHRATHVSRPEYFTPKSHQYGTRITTDYAEPDIYVYIIRVQ